MPFYDYKCEKCGNEFRKMLTGERRNELQACPKCGNPTQKRLTVGSVISYNVPNN